jgi:hypothetical protein
MHKFTGCNLAVATGIETAFRRATRVHPGLNGATD